MRITTKAILDFEHSETGRLIFWRGYEYEERVDKLCSDSAQVMSSDLALQQADVASTKALSADMSTTFSESQNALAAQQAKLAYIASNPSGFSPEQLHSATTSINQNYAASAKNAIGESSAYAASHGGADFAGGGASEMVGKIASDAATGKASSLSQLDLANQQMKQSNMLNALSGLSSVGKDYSADFGTSAGDIGSTSGAGSTAGGGVIQAGSAAADATGTILQGIGGIAGAAVKA